jgi:uncharacterized protein YutE (UPF0331/DUF86 family)
VGHYTLKTEKSVVSGKIDQILNCLKRIEDQKPFELKDLENNYDLQDIVSLNLQRLIQTAVDLAADIVAELDERTPQSMAETFKVLARKNIIPEEIAQSLVKSVGLRNALVLDYDEIRWEIVLEVCNSHLNVFKDFIRVAQKSL